MRVNLFDSAFSHVPYSVPGRTSKHIEWVRGQREWSGVTVVTDARLGDGYTLECLKSKVTVGWLLEGRAYGSANYDAIPGIIDRLDLLLTHDERLLRTYPEKARFVPFGGCWIPDEKWGMHPKSKFVSMIYSQKNFMEGHKLRHWVVRRGLDVDLFGLGSQRPIACKSEGLASYRYSIVIENDRAPNYFTEKLIDCFALGTIPIYWGCPNIGDFFDAEGIVQVGYPEDIRTAVDRFVFDVPAGILEAAERNLVTARKYVLPEDYIYEHVLMPYDPELSDRCEGCGYSLCMCESRP